MRVRFAPSPTGHLHVGNARTALFNWLLARGTGGTFILRIEDTDAERSTRASESAIHEDLRWLGLTWDEGPDVGGPCGPYRQSERLPVYAAHAERLLASGGGVLLLLHDRSSWKHSVRPRSPAGSQPKYPGTCRIARSRRLTCARGRAVSRRSSASSSRPTAKSRFDDAVRGAVSFDTAVIGDPVLVRSDGHPAYNFAVVVDDALMRVTHVIRGEDHISNTPRQLLLYEAFGYAPPTFAHLSLVLGSGSQPALEAPRRDVGGGVSRQGISAGSAVQLSRADRMVAGAGCRAAAGRGARGAVQAGRRRSQRRRVRRGQARVGEPPLPEGRGAGAARVCSRHRTSPRQGTSASSTTNGRAFVQSLVPLFATSVDRLQQVPDRLRVVFAFERGCCARAA